MTASDIRRALASRLPPDACQFPWTINRGTGALVVRRAYVAALQNNTWDGPACDGRAPLAHVLAAAGIGDLTFLTATTWTAMGPGGKAVAVKILDVPSPSTAAAFLEAYVCGRVSSFADAGRVTGFPATYATLYGTWHGKPAVAVVNEYVLGEPFAVVAMQCLAHPSPANCRRLFPLLHQLLVAIDGLHRVVGVVHNDLHLGNIIVTPAGRLAVIDYGRSTVCGTPTPDIARYTHWNIQSPEMDMAYVAAMLTLAVPAGQRLETIAARAAAPWNAALDALAHLVRRTLSCPGAPDLLGRYQLCHDALLRGDDARCTTTLLHELRARASGCAGLAPAAWLQDEALAQAFLQHKLGGRHGR